MKSPIYLLIVFFVIILFCNCPAEASYNDHTEAVYGWEGSSFYTGNPLAGNAWWWSTTGEFSYWPDCRWDDGIHLESVIGDADGEWWVVFNVPDDVRAYVTSLTIKAYTYNGDQCILQLFDHDAFDWSPSLGGFPSSEGVHTKIISSPDKYTRDINGGLNNGEVYARIATEGSTDNVDVKWLQLYWTAPIPSFLGNLWVPEGVDEGESDNQCEADSNGEYLVLWSIAGPVPDNPSEWLWEIWEDADPAFPNPTKYGNDGIGIFPQHEFSSKGEGHWYYKAVAMNSYGEGEHTEIHDVASVRAPTNFQAEAISSTQVHLTWNDNSNVAIDYRILRRVGTSGGYTHSFYTGSGDSIEYVDSTVSPNTIYTYKVEAIYYVRIASNEVVVTTPYTLTVQSIPIESVVISGSYPGLTNYTVNCSDGEVVTLIAAWDSQGQYFLRWEDESQNIISYNSTIGITMDSDKTVVAIYGNVTDFYVNDETSENGIAVGNDDNSGTSPEAPMASIQNLLNRYPLIGTGCTLHISEGTYSEEVTIYGAHSGLTILGAGASDTIIDGIGGFALYFNDGFNTGTINELTIQNALFGIYCTDASSSTVNGCTIQSNRTGIYADSDCYPTISHCDFNENIDYALILPAGTIGRVTNNSFVDNSHNNRIYVSGGQITEDGTWTNQTGLTGYEVQGSVMVASTDVGELNTVTLTIDPGVEIYLWPSGYFQIGDGSSHWGKLHAVGTELEQIIFTSAQGSPVPGNWGGINFTTTAKMTSIMDYCQILYPDEIYLSKGVLQNSTVTSCDNGLYVEARDGRIVTIDNFEITDSTGVGLSLDASNSGQVLVEDVNVIDSGGDGIWIGCFDGGFIQLTDCEVANNAGIGVDIIQTSGSEVVIQGSGTSVHNNEASGIYWNWNNQQNIAGTLQDARIYENELGISCYNNSSPLIRNCVIAGHLNYEPSINLNNSNPTIHNCTITNNSFGIYMENSSPIINSCILWDNLEQNIEVGSGTPIVSYSDIQDGWPGKDNNDVDPCFIDPYNGNYHLMSEAGRWDSNELIWVYDDVTSPCIDTGDPNSDWTSELWPHGKRINMGAYGGTPEASMSLSNIGNIANLDDDVNDVVNVNDLDIFVSKWCYEEFLLAEDLNRDGLVDFFDFAIFAQFWSESTK